MARLLIRGWGWFSSGWLLGLLGCQVRFLVLIERWGQLGHLLLWRATVCYLLTFVLNFTPGWWRPCPRLLSWGLLAVAIFLPVAGAFSASAQDQVAEQVEPPTRVVILGTGTPNADPERSGPALAVIAGGQAYLIDAGPGVVRQAAAAAEKHGIAALQPEGLSRLFLTHLHSDHTVGLPDAILSPWVLDRPEPLQVAGPPGTDAMVHHVLAAWQEDIHMRLFGLEPREANADAYRTLVTQTTGGLVYEDENVSVTAIPVAHGSWPHSLGYKFVAGGRTIVISGDARPSESLVGTCDGCDLLIHEVYSADAFKGRPPEWQAYHADAHTSTVELAELASRARPKLLVMYHQLFWGTTDDDLLAEIRAAGYSGAVVSAADLDIY